MSRTTAAPSRRRSIADPLRAWYRRHRIDIGFFSKAAFLVVCFAAGVGLAIWDPGWVDAVDADEVARDMRVATDGGRATCPHDLDARVGAVVDCTVSGLDGGPFVVRATVTSVDGADVAYDFHRMS